MSEKIITDINRLLKQEILWANTILSRSLFQVFISMIVKCICISDIYNIMFQQFYTITSVWVTVTW